MIDVIRIEHIDASDHVSRVLVVGAESNPVELYIESDGILAKDLTGWVPILTVVAMGVGKDVHFAGQVDRQALHGALEAVSMLHGWFPDRLKMIRVTADKPTEQSIRSPGEAALFSGGVDSFFTVQRHIETLTHLLFIHGMDIGPDDWTLFDKVQAGLQQAAQALDLPLVTARTNMRSFADRHVDWLKHYHGSAIISVALSHQGTRGKVYLASTYERTQQVPLGSHVDLDPLWSSSACSIIHDGVDADRTEKVRAISNFDTALQYLRVCWLNPNSDYNCGKCRKCVLTMVALELAGSLEKCRTLPPQLNYWHVISSMREAAAPVLRFQRDNLRTARAMEIRNRRLEAALLLGLLLAPGWSRLSGLRSRGRQSLRRALPPIIVQKVRQHRQR